MSIFLKFFYEFFMNFLNSVWSLVRDFFVNLWSIFNVVRYAEIFDMYMRDFSGLEWVLAIFVLLTVVASVALAIWGIVLFVKKRLLVKRRLKEKVDMLEQVDELNRQVVKLIDEKDKIMALQVGRLGYGESSPLLAEAGGGSIPLGTNMYSKPSGSIAGGDESRFVKLIEVDKFYEATPFTLQDKQDYTLEELVKRFRAFACSKNKLYYEENILRTFIAGMATSHIIIIEGISGTGKTSLPYVFGKFCKHDSSIIAVQPSWRDKTELIGYLNEFTKRFNETDFLKTVYEATYRSDVGVVVLDEMNLARVEYYFAEILSVLEMPDPSEWKIDVVPDTWDNDPKGLKSGKLSFPTNTWFVGTANNDDSTFTITDKVYDRALPITLNSKGVPFECEDTEPMQIEAEYLQSLFDKARLEHEVSQENLEKFDNLDDYIITNFRLSFGNRILKQILDFVPVYVACGGTELDGLDYMLCNKILRKLEGLNIAFAQEGLKKLILYIDRVFGKKELNASRSYITRLIKTASV